MVFRFTIDDILSPYVPLNQAGRLPKPIARFLGYHSPKPQPDYYLWLEVLIGSFVGILTLEGIFKSPNIFTDHHHAPIIIASYGASAILCFNASQAPLAQPRNVVVGQFVAALLSTCIEKLFSLSQTGRDHYYLGGALSVAVVSTFMSILNVVHPPAGASALLPFIDEQIRQMGWWIIPAHLVSSVVIVGIAMITGNIFRRYPVYWFSPADKKQPKPEDKEEKQQGSGSGSGSETTIGPSIWINEKELIIPDELELDEVEIEFLQTIKLKIESLTTFPV